MKRYISLTLVLFSLVSYGQISTLKNKLNKKSKEKTELEMANKSEGSDILKDLERASNSLDRFLNSSDRNYFDFFKGNSAEYRDTLFNRGENHNWDVSQIETYESYVNKIKAFYAENNMKFVDMALPSIKPYYDKAEFWCAENRTTSNFKEKTHSWSDIKPALTAINIANNHCEAALKFTPDHVELKKEFALVKARYEDLNSFVNSGEYENFLARKKVEEIDAVRMSKAGSSNASYIAMASKNAQAELREGEKVLRTIISSSEWTIQKNNLGVPINKIMYYQIAYKDTDGNCRLGKGTIVRTYEGGGKYASAHANYAGRAGKHNGAINCDNVNK